jgi:hypothetical protein
MRESRRSTGRWVMAGVALALFLHVAVGWWSLPGLAQGGNTTTATNSTKTNHHSITPPACSVIGAVVATNVTTTVNVYIGPQTIYVGLEQQTPFPIAAGGMDIDTLVTTDIWTCVAAVPAMKWPMLGGTALMLSGLAAWTLRRRGRTTVGSRL